MPRDNGRSNRSTNNPEVDPEIEQLLEAETVLPVLSAIANQARDGHTLDRKRLLAPIRRFLSFNPKARTRIHWSSATLKRDIKLFDRACSRLCEYVPVEEPFRSQEEPLRTHFSLLALGSLALLSHIIQILDDLDCCHRSNASVIPPYVQCLVELMDYVRQTTGKPMFAELENLIEACAEELGKPHPKHIKWLLEKFEYRRRRAHMRPSRRQEPRLCIPLLDWATCRDGKKEWVCMPPPEFLEWPLTVHVCFQPDFLNLRIPLPVVQGIPPEVELDEVVIERPAGVEGILAAQVARKRRKNLKQHGNLDRAK